MHVCELLHNGRLSFHSSKCRLYFGICIFCCIYYLKLIFLAWISSEHKAEYIFSKYRKVVDPNYVQVKRLYLCFYVCLFM